MKATGRQKLLCALLIAALLLQCAPMSFAAAQAPILMPCGEDEPITCGEQNDLPKDESAALVQAAAALPSSYDSRNQGLVTPVRMQGGANNCWAFASIAALETNFIKQGLGTATGTDFSEAHLAWFTQRQRTTDTSDPTYGDGLNYTNPFINGGSWEHVAAQLMRGAGLQLEQNAPWYELYDGNAMLQKMKQQESDRYTSYARMWSATRIRGNDPTLLKQTIMENGAAILSYHDDAQATNGQGANPGFNRNTSSYYQGDTTKQWNHTVEVIGWNDNYPVSSFNADKRPTSPGAWLVKGSWGTDYGSSGGYYWISYQEPSLSEFVAFKAAPKDAYDNIYQYDGARPGYMELYSDTGYMVNVFTAKNKEMLTHIAFNSRNAVPVNATAEIYVLPEGKQFQAPDTKNWAKSPLIGFTKITDATTQADGVEYGYTTIKLNKPVLLQPGQTFGVYVSMTATSGNKILIPVELESKQDSSESTVLYNTTVGDVGFFGYSGVWWHAAKFYSDLNNQENVTPKNLNNIALKAMTRSVQGNPTLTVATPPYKTTYFTGEVPDTTGMELFYTDEFGMSEQVTEGFICDTTAFSVPGTQSVTVTYKDAAAVFDVIVRQPGILLATDAHVRAGEKFDVSVNVYDNPGVLSALFKVTYDPNTLMLIGARNGGVFPDTTFLPGDVTQMPYSVMFRGTHSGSGADNGNLFVLTFIVRPDAPPGATAVGLSYDDDFTYDADRNGVRFLSQSGTVTVARLPGDVNADGVVDLKDAVVLRRYLAAWNVPVNLANADVDRKEGVNLKDVTCIHRYLAEGYDVVLL